MKGRGLRYTAEELEWIEACHELPRRELHRLFQILFDRPEVGVEALKKLCLRKGWKTGRTGCFPKGSTPPNKGKKMLYNAASARTQFKKGDRPHTYKGPGYERIDAKDGYVLLTVEDGVRYPSSPNRSTRTVRKHRYLWEKKNGPVPAAHVLKSVDGNRQNCDPDNWIAIPQALMPRLAGRWSQPYDSAPDELKPTLLAVSRLAHRTKGARRKAGKLTPQERWRDRRKEQRT